MNLKPLYETQKVLKNRIGYKGEDRFNKLILALLVEIGECANEQRSWKYWSQNQKPRTKAVRHAAMMEEDKEYYNPLLEEYVDGLHFVLELGLEIDNTDPDIQLHPFYEDTIEEQFLLVIDFAAAMKHDDYYDQLVSSYLVLGSKLGFDQIQIEQAYMEKNKINHLRQINGY